MMRVLAFELNIILQIYDNSTNSTDVFVVERFHRTVKRMWYGTSKTIVVGVGSSAAAAAAMKRARARIIRRRRCRGYSHVAAVYYYYFF